MSATDLSMPSLYRSSTAPTQIQPQQQYPSTPTSDSAGGAFGGLRRSNHQSSASQSRLAVAVPGRTMRRARSSIEIERFAENEGDADFSDIFLPDDSATERDDSDNGSEMGDGALMLMSKMSGSSWLGDDEDEHDPFASLDQGFDQMDLEANIARNRHARLSERVESLVRSLTLSANEDDLSAYAGELVRNFFFFWIESLVNNVLTVISSTCFTKTPSKSSRSSYLRTVCCRYSRFWSRARPRRDTA